MRALVGLADPGCCAERRSADSADVRCRAELRALVSRRAFPGDRRAAAELVEDSVRAYAVKLKPEEGIAGEKPGQEIELAVAGNPVRRRVVGFL